LDYPQAGADDLVADTELKYEYILHAGKHIILVSSSEQNALLYRTPPGRRFTKDTILVSTKMPCDECSPMIADLGIQNVYTNRQVMKKSNDPLKARGLSYQKVHRLIKNVFVFDTVVNSRPVSSVSSPERPLKDI
jgi:deoxycytidylate deaminase